MSIGIPKTGQVICYSFLWSDGAEKERPAVIIVAIQQKEDGKYKVVAMPITHSAPHNPELAVQMPHLLKEHLSLDDEKSWVVCNEVNVFEWPGFDLRPIPGKKSLKWEYGQIPPAFHRQLVERYEILEHL